MNTNSEVELECMRVTVDNGIGPITLLFMAEATCGELRLTNKRVRVKAVFPSNLLAAVWMFGLGKCDILLTQIASIEPYEPFRGLLQKNAQGGMIIQTKAGKKIKIISPNKERRDTLLVKIQAAMNTLQQG